MEFIGIILCVVWDEGRGLMIVLNSDVCEVDECFLLRGVWEYL